MKKPDEPEDEPIRIEMLNSLAILDTPPEERFDRLTRLAKRVFDVPIAVVGFVDQDRQWFKSAQGLEVKQTSRDISFCGHTILRDDILVIPDATADERFADNPLVTNEPYIRFYAGCPIRAPDGSKLGSLCIMDQTPRQPSKDDLDSLADLAAIAEREFSVCQMATTDELTHIANRRGFMLLAQHRMNLCVRENITLTLVYMDLNKFKSINDRLGHDEGDHALRVFADHLKQTFRDSDLIGRLGGDEFVVLFANHAGETIDQTMARLHQSLEHVNRDGQQDYRISFAYGIATYDPETHSSIEALLTEGETRMYQDKDLENCFENDRN